MHIQSMYPENSPPSDANAHFTLLRRPEQAEWTDFALHIDARTGNTRTFREFAERVQYAATALGAPVFQGGLGLSPENGDIVGIISYNCLDYITLIHACLYIATPFALISALSKPFELKSALNLSRATCLFVDEKLLSNLLPVAKELGISSKRIFVMSDGILSGKRRSFSELIDQIRARKANVIPVRPVRKDSLAYLVFSSGTTGLPKAVMISHGNINFVINQFIMVANATITHNVNKAPSSMVRYLAFLPMHHCYGLFYYCFKSFLAPVTLVVMPSWDLDMALSLVPKYKITHLTLVPSIVHQLVHHPKTSRTDLSSVIEIACGAAYLPPELKDKFVALASAQARFSEGYGMSECTLSALRRPVNDVLTWESKSQRGSIGTLTPGMEARIIIDDDATPDGTLAIPNQIGNLWLRGGNVALGYWNNEQATKETFVDGWLNTGDRFSVDEDGYFYFADRAKDILKVSGVQVSPVEIESVLLAHPRKLIQDVAVAGVSGGRTSDEKIPRAWIVLSLEGEKLGARQVVKALDDWQRENLSKYKWLRGGIEVVEEIPKSSTGKVLRRELQERYEGGVALEKVKSKL